MKKTNLVVQLPFKMVMAESWKSQRERMRQQPTGGGIHCLHASELVMRLNSELRDSVEIVDIWNNWHFPAEMWTTWNVWWSPEKWKKNDLEGAAQNAGLTKSQNRPKDHLALQYTRQLTASDGGKQLEAHHDLKWRVIEKVFFLTI